jgi:hypothetical protein
MILIKFLLKSLNIMNLTYQMIKLNIWCVTSILFMCHWFIPINNCGKSTWLFTEYKESKATIYLVWCCWSLSKWKVYVSTWAWKPSNREHFPHNISHRLLPFNFCVHKQFYSPLHLLVLSNVLHVRRRNNIQRCMLNRLKLFKGCLN